MPSSLTIKESITHALVQLMMKKQYNEITTSDVIKKSGVCRSSFYRTYKDKDEVLHNYIKYTFSNCPTYFKECDNLPIHDHIMMILKLIKENSLLLKALEVNHLLGLLTEQFYDLFDQYIKKHNIIITNYERSYYCYSSMGIIIEWIRNDFKESEEELTQICLNLYLKR